MAGRLAKLIHANLEDAYYPAFLKADVVSSRIIYRHGTITRIIAVANTIPNPSDIAIGINWYAWREVSSIIGVRPPKVVNVVSKIGRKRLKPAS